MKRGDDEAWRGEPSRDEPWHDEPDRVAWRDSATGLQCLILRAPMGNLCGYVRVPRDHALHGKRYRQCGIERRISVHGGITFSGCIGGRRMKRGHWFGFDCAHGFDLVPGMRRLLDHDLALFRGLGEILTELDNHEGPPTVYRDVEYVRAECTSLAAQLAQKGRVDDRSSSLRQGTTLRRGVDPVREWLDFWMG